MKRWLFRIAAALSLLVSLAAVVAWASSYAGRPDWRLIATAHSADLTRVDSPPRTALFTTTPDWSKTPNHGFWDAWWARSQSGRLILLAQVIDYEGTLSRVHAAPPRLVIDPPGAARSQVAVFEEMPEAGPTTNPLGFALRTDAELADAVSARTWMVLLPYWFLVSIGLPLPLLWMRGIRRRQD